MAAKTGGKRFSEKWPHDSADTIGVKTLTKIILSHIVSEINMFCILRRNGKKTILEENSQTTLQIPLGLKISPKLLSRTFSEIYAFLRFTQDFTMAAKNGGKTTLGKWEKRPDDSAEILEVKTFAEIALFLTVSEIFKIFHFHC